MSTTSMSGQDTIIIQNRSLADLGEGDVIDVTFPNNVADVKTGKNGNSIFSFNATGKQCEVKIRIIKGSGDDKFLNGLYNSQNYNFAGFTTLSGQFIKKIGDGKGKVGSDTYILSGGIFMKGIEAKSNVEGSVEQSVSVYTLKFASGTRVIS